MPTQNHNGALPVWQGGHQSAVSATGGFKLALEIGYGALYFQIRLEGVMAVKILIKRHFKENAAEQALGLLHSFRQDAMNRPGYISGETWINHYDPCRITVVSTWQTVEDWIQWEESDQRAANEAKLVGILKTPALFEVYDLGGSPE
jgi:heme-degrading monooxygenase HmoA